MDQPCNSPKIYGHGAHFTTFQAGRIFFISRRMALACALTKRQAFTCGQEVCGAQNYICMSWRIFAKKLFLKCVKIVFDLCVWHFLWPHHATHLGYPHRSPCHWPILTWDVAQDLNWIGIVWIWIRWEDFNLEMKEMRDTHMNNSSNFANDIECYLCY